MDEDTFWAIIEDFKWIETGNDHAVLEPSCAALAQLDEDAIFKFHDLLSEKLHSLDTREHCRACYRGQLDPDDGDDYISPDDFLYARCVVVANGRGVYEQVLAEPSRMPRDMEFESLLYLPNSAYERKTGLEYAHYPPVSYESFQNTTGWAPTSRTRPGKYTSDSMPPGNRRPS